MITIKELQIKNSLHILIINTDEDVKKKEYSNTLVFVLSQSRVWLFVILWTAACQASLSFTISQSLLKLMTIESVISSNHLIFCHTLLLLPLIFPSIRVFSSESAFHISSQSIGASASAFSLCSEYLGLVSLRLTHLITLQSRVLSRVFSNTTVQKPSILRCTAFFMVQLSHPYMTTGKTVALTIWTFAGKVISLLFSTLSRLDIAFLLRRKHLLISWLQSPSTIILEPKKIKSVTASTFPLSICHKVMGLDSMILIHWMLSFKPAFFTLFSHTHQEAL